MNDLAVALFRNLERRLIYWGKVWSERSKQQQSSGASGGTY